MVKDDNFPDYSLQKIMNWLMTLSDLAKKYQTGKATPVKFISETVNLRFCFVEILKN